MPPSGSWVKQKKKIAESGHRLERPMVGPECKPSPLQVVPPLLAGPDSRQGFPPTTEWDHSAAEKDFEA